MLHLGLYLSMMLAMLYLKRGEIDFFGVYTGISIAYIIAIIVN